MRSGSNNIPESPQKAARKTSEHLELSVREITEEWAARPSIPSTPRNLPKAARRTWRHRGRTGWGWRLAAATYLGSLGGYNKT